MGVKEFGDAMSERPPFCGDMPMRASQLVSRDPSGGLPALFAGRRVAFSFNTRVAIRKACDLLGLRPGDEVLAPSYNCGSEIDPLLHAGLKVRLYPVGPRGEVNPDDLAPLVSARTRAVYLTHYFGFLQPAAQAVRGFCDRHGLWLLEDCALSLLSGPTPAEGRAGDVAFFCFYKFFPTLAGGAMVINSDRIGTTPRFDAALPPRMAAKPRLRAGIDMALGAERRSALMRRRKAAAPLDAAPFPDMPAGYYFDPRLQDAALSRLTARQIRSFPVAETIARRRANYRSYLSALAALPGATPLFPDLPADVCPLSMPVLVADRDRIAAQLQAQGIAATPWWAGYHRGLDFSGQDEACRLKDHVLALPCHQDLSEAAIRHICGALAGLLQDTGSRDRGANRL